MNFKIKNVRQRLYRGRCPNNEHVPASVQVFLDHKDEIYDLVNLNELYKGKTRKKTLGFLDEFYQIIESPERVQSRLINECIG